MLLKIALASLWNRRFTVSLTIISVAISVALLIGIDHLRKEVKTGFGNTVSGVDLIVGSRTSPINLLLYSIFHIGDATNNISWKSYQELSSDSNVAWAIPISLGDSHHGYRVMGTSDDYFTHFKFGNKQTLAFQQGKVFEGVYDVVLGAEVARKLNYDLGQKVVLSHGVSKVSFSKHGDKPFTVMGILEPTGTPVDKLLYVSLAGIEAIHVGWENGVVTKAVSAEDALKHDLTPVSITAFMVGLKSRIETFNYQRQINTYSQEPLLAILPGVTLSQLWQMMSGVEKMLWLISALVLIATMVGLATMLLASMNERQREMAILRAMGAHALTLLFLIELEAVMIAILGVILGIALLVLGLVVAQPLLADQYGLFISSLPLDMNTGFLVLLVVGLAALLAFIPALLAYRKSLSAGLVQR